MSDQNNQRIVSLVPSLTELLYDLGLSDQVVGRTRFCIHPKGPIEKIEIIGGTKNPNIDKIRELNPDLIIANKEENRKEDVCALRNFTKVLVTQIESPEDALREIKRIGRATGKLQEVEIMTDKIQSMLPSESDYESVSAAYLIWRDPWMSVGNDTYIHHIMELFGLKNIFGTQSRYPVTQDEELLSLQPELILLSSEPYPFKEKHIAELKQILPGSVIKLVDGEWFSWYGSRMLKALPELRQWREELNEQI
ncbi:helical backbone metal receptor [Balneola sp. MJW-20]|uniref:helical backbone metal receptor n=1 Tax=Gracilimonas aurantiaca TaxID=3234185 RepID=UPI003464E992